MIDSSDSSEHSLSDKDQKSIAKGGVTTPFPWKLHNMLDDMADKGEHSVVTWQPHGRAFMVHKPKVFVEDIMHHYFNQTKVSISSARVDPLQHINLIILDVHSTPLFNVS